MMLCHIWLVLIFGMPLFTACASGPKIVNHSFSFDARIDSRDVEILDFRYGTYAMAQAPEWRIKQGKVQQQWDANGGIPIGDTLYVKWRLKETNEILQDTVDLRARLPRVIEGNRIHFVVQQRQLYVYLITAERRPENWPKYGPLGGYSHRKTFILYPISTLQYSKPEAYIAWA